MGDEEDRPRTVLAGVDDLVAALGVVIRLRPPEGTGRVVRSRLARHGQHDLVAHVEVGVVVVVEVARRDAVADEDHVGFGRSVGRHRERQELLAERQVSRGGCDDGERVAAAEFDAGRDRKRLEEGLVVAARLEAGFREDALDVLAGAVGARSARAAAVHLGRREGLDLIEQPGGRRQGRIGGEGSGRDGEDDQDDDRRAAKDVRDHVIDSTR